MIIMTNIFFVSIPSVYVVGRVFTNTRDYSCISFSAKEPIYLHPASLENRGMTLIQQSQWQNSWSIMKEIIPLETF